jgi:hypothetical protein
VGSEGKRGSETTACKGQGIVEYNADNNIYTIRRDPHIFMLLWRLDIQKAQKISLQSLEM